MFLMRWLTILATIAIGVYAKTQSKIVCYYNSASHLREGQGKFVITDLEHAVPYCTHIIYGYAAINDKNLKLVPMNENFDTVQDNYRQVTNLKKKYPNAKFLLSVGGFADVSEGTGEEKNIKYRNLIESASLRLSFINSAYTIVKAYGFDGLDLAWEFPETKPKKIRSSIGKIWSNLKHKVAGPSIIDKKAEEHRNQFTALVRELKRTFKPEDLLVSMTVLPNVNSTVYYDPKNLAQNLDFINIMAFDFYTPQRNPSEADHSAPLFGLIDRKYDENIDYQVKYWLKDGAPSSKIILGIPTYGRTWKMTTDSDINAVPPLTVDGSGDMGPYTLEKGILSYPEICLRVDYQKIEPKGTTPPTLPLRYQKVIDTSKRKGNYAYRLPDSDNKGGIWISYEDPESFGTKAAYVKATNLGGIAVNDLSMDDFKGICTHDRYPLLRAANSYLQ